MKRTIITVVLTLALSAFAIQAVEQTAFSGAGIIESTSGGFMFPDGSLQTTAMSPPCTPITEISFVITKPGIYCLSAHLGKAITEGNALTVNADDVVIDLSGWTLDGQAVNSNTSAIGIYAYQRRNITIRNGTIRGFHKAVFLEDDLVPESYLSKGHLVEHVQVEDSTYIGLDVIGSESTLRYNRIIHTGSPDWGTQAFGIKVEGPNMRVLGNDVANTAAEGPSETAGILLRYSSFSVVEANRIIQVSMTKSSHENPAYWPTNGIWVFLSDDVLVVDNRIMTTNYAISWSGPSTGAYRDNLAYNVEYPFVSGTDAGGNWCSKVNPDHCYW